MSVETERTESNKQEDINSDSQLEPSREHDSSTGAEKDAPEMDIDPENEVTGIKLLLIHTGICLCTFLIGLVSCSLEDLAKDGATANKRLGLQSDRNSSPSHHI